MAALGQRIGAWYGPLPGVYHRDHCASTVAVRGDAYVGNLRATIQACLAGVEVATMAVVIFTCWSLGLRQHTGSPERLTLSRVTFWGPESCRMSFRWPRDALGVAETECSRLVLDTTVWGICRRRQSAAKAATARWWKGTRLAQRTPWLPLT